MYVYGPTLLSEPLFLFFLAAALWLLVCGTQTADGRAFAASGAAVALAALTRPGVWLFPLVWCAALAAAMTLRRARAHIRPLAKPAGLFLAGYLALCAPWVVKNAVFFGNVGIANGFGAVLYLGTDLRKDGDEPIYSQMQFDTFELTAPHTHFDEEGDALLTKAALARIRAFPLDVALLTLRKIPRVLFGYPNYYFYPQRSFGRFVAANPRRKVCAVMAEMVLVAAAVCGALAALVFLPMPLLLRWWAGTLAAYLTALHAVTFPIPRLMLPLIMLAVPLGAGFWAACGRRKSTYAAACAAVLVVVLIGSWAPSRFSMVSSRYADYFTLQRAVEVGAPLIWNGLAPEENGCVTVTGADPYLVFTLPPFEAQPNQMIFVSMASFPRSKSGLGRMKQLELSWSDGSGFDEARRVPAAFKVVSDARTIAFSPSTSALWRGTLSALRLDFPKSAAGARYCLQSLEVRK